MGILSTIFDGLFGRKPNPYQPQGTGTTQTIGGFLISPERNPKLATGLSRAKTYDEISLNTAIVATGLRYFSSLIAGITWNLKVPKDGGALADTYAGYIKKNMDGMEEPWYRVVRTTGSFKWVGFSVQEWLAERMDWIGPGYIGIGTVQNRPQVSIEQWDLEDQTNRVLGWLQRDPNTGTMWPLDRRKSIYVCDSTLTASPDGIGLLRHVVELCDQLKRLEQLEGWAYETDLRGVPIGRAPTAILDDMVAKNRMTRADADAKLAGIQNFITNHIKNPQLGLLLDSSAYTSADAARTPSSQAMWGLELAKGNGLGLAEIHVAIERKNHEIARALGIEQFMLGAASKGSLALSEDKTRNLLELVNATVNEIAWTLQKDYLGAIFMLNRWDRKYMPELQPDAVALRSVGQIVDALSKLALAGAIIDRNDPVINQLRQMMKLVDQPTVTPEMVAALAPPTGGAPNAVGDKKPSPNAPSKENPNKHGGD